MRGGCLTGWRFPQVRVVLEAFEFRLRPGSVTTAYPCHRTPAGDLYPGPEAAIDAQWGVRAFERESGGVGIAGVRDGSPATKAGLGAGNIIVEFG